MKKRRTNRSAEDTGLNTPREKSTLAGRMVFALLLILPAVGTILFGAVDPATWTLVYVWSALVLVLWLRDAWAAGAVSINAPGLLIPIAGLIVIGIIQTLPLFPSAVPAGLFADSVRGTISMDPYATRMFVGRLAVYLLFLAAALTFINSKSRKKTVVIFTIVFGSLMAMFAILQRLAHVEMIYGLRDTPGAIFFGPFVNQHHFAAFMEMTGGLVFGFLFAPGTKQQIRIVLGLAAVIMGTAAIMTSSRGGMISFTAVILLSIAISVFARGRKTGSDPASGSQKLATVSFAGGLFVIIIGTVLFLGADSSLIRSLGFVGGDVSSGRTHFWAIALQIFAAHPVLGTGLDAFGSAFTRYDTWPGIFRIEQAHNDYLQTLADAGLVGFACVAAFIYLLFRRSIDAISVGRDGFRRSAAVGALCGCFGILVHSFFDFPLRTPSNAFFFLLLTAIAVAPPRLKGDQRTLTESSF